MKPKTGYAYLDETGILHIVEDICDAVRFSGNGKIVTTTIPFYGGYPIAEYGKKKNQLIVYGPQCILTGDGEELMEERLLFRLTALWELCKG